MDEENYDINEQSDYEAIYIAEDEEEDPPLATISTEIRPSANTKSLKDFMSKSSASIDGVNLSSSMGFQDMPQLTESELICSSVLVTENSDLTQYFEPISNASTEKTTDIHIKTSSGEELLKYSPNDILALESKLISAQNEVHRLREELKLSKAEAIDLSIQEKKYENMIDKYKREAFEALEKCSKLEAVKVSLNEKTKELEEVKKEMVSIEKEKDEMEKKWDKTRNDLEVCKAELNKNKMESSRLKAEYESSEQKRNDHLIKAEAEVDVRRLSLEQRVKDSEVEILRLDEQVSRIALSLSVPLISLCLLVEPTAATGSSGAVAVTAQVK
jgi:myosin heavy subunit